MSEIEHFGKFNEGCESYAGSAGSWEDGERDEEKERRDAWDHGERSIREGDFEACDQVQIPKDPFGYLGKSRHDVPGDGKYRPGPTSTVSEVSELGQGLLPGVRGRMAANR